MILPEREAGQLAPPLATGGAISGACRMVRAAARFGVRPRDVDGIEPGEMGVMLVLDEVLRAESREGRAL